MSKDIAIADIKIGKRYRKELGDVAGLAASIERVGLLHPVVLSPEKKLIVGHRRIAAYKRLGREKIPATLATNLTELSDLLCAEADENTCRLNLLPVEAADTAAALRPVVAKLAKEKQEAGKSEDGKAGGRGKRKNLPQTLGKVSDKHAKETATVVAKAVGLSRTTLEKIEAVKASGDETLIAEMNKTRKADKAYRKLKAKQQAEIEREAAAKDKSDLWAITNKQGVIQCAALITDPPYGILNQPWEPKKLEAFTRKWAVEWRSCEADLLAVFWSQRHLWDGRRWFDECFAGYAFQQLLVWHYRNNKSPQSRMGFKQTWEPIFLYRREGSTREVKIGDGKWGEDMHDFDCHVAAVPQENFTGENMKQHPAQKPVSVMRWLVNALTVAGELVADPFCGSGTTGVAAVQLGRRFHGIETDAEYTATAKGRIASYGNAIRETAN